MTGKSRRLAQLEQRRQWPWGQPLNQQIGFKVTKEAKLLWDQALRLTGEQGPSLLREAVEKYIILVFGENMNQEET